jgi:uncharacterized protein (DUF1330 family)
VSAAYVIGHITVKDAAKWDAYRAQVPATLAPWGAELVLRGKRAATFAGPHAHDDVVVIRFPDLASGQWLARFGGLPGPGPAADAGGGRGAAFL